MAGIIIIIIICGADLVQLIADRKIYIYTYIRGTGRRERFTALALLQPRSEIRNRLRSLLLH